MVLDEKDHNLPLKLTLYLFCLPAMMFLLAKLLYYFFKSKNMACLLGILLFRCFTLFCFVMQCDSVTYLKTHSPVSGKCYHLFLVRKLYWFI